MPRLGKGAPKRQFRRRREYHRASVGALSLQVEDTTLHMSVDLESERVSSVTYHGESWDLLVKTGWKRVPGNPDLRISVRIIREGEVNETD